MSAFHLTPIVRTFPTEAFGEATIHTSTYVNDGLAIQLTCNVEGFTEPLAKLSVWLDATPGLPKNCFFVKTWSENGLILGDCAKSGWFKFRKDLHTYMDPVWELLDVRGEPIDLTEML